MLATPHADDEAPPAPPGVPDPHDVPLKPPGAREFTPRAVLLSIVVSAIIGASYPYVVLKLGFGPNISVVSAFFGFLALGIVFRNFSRWENNVIQSAGTAAGGIAFLCTLLAAFDLLRLDQNVAGVVSPTPFQAFLWLSAAGVLGVLLAVPLRRHYIVDERLPFPDGIAAAETILILDARGRESLGATVSMGVSTLVSAAIMTVREDARLVREAWYRIPEMLPLGPTGSTMAVGTSWSLLSLGAGMLVSFRVNLSMLVGTILSWVIAPPLLVERGIVADLVRRDVLLWVMWPATGMLIAGGLAALVLRWSVMVRTFRNLSQAKVGGGDFPIRGVALGSIGAALALVVVQATALHMPVWMTLTAIGISLPLMLVAIRVMGETNWGPVSALSNTMQAVFGVLAPGQVMPNMVASGVTGSIASESESLMQAYKTGAMMGSTPRFLTYAQLLAVPVGAATVSYVYPLLRDTYGIGGERGLQSPISQKWAGFATLLSQGLDALPAGALLFLVIGVALGVLLTVLEGTRARGWTPSPTGLGIGMLVPGSAIVTMFLGGLLVLVWRRLGPKSAEQHVTPMASGFIAGEAIVAVVIPILVAAGIVALQ